VIRLRNANIVEITMVQRVDSSGVVLPQDSDMFLEKLFSEVFGKVIVIEVVFRRVVFARTSCKSEFFDGICINPTKDAIENVNFEKISNGSNVFIIVHSSTRV
jgi:hypothetical protein